MSGDVRSLEEVIAAVLLDKADFDGFELTAQLFANEQAAAVREWCLAPQQIERATAGLAATASCDPPCSACASGARAALHAVMGDTP